MRYLFTLWKDLNETSDHMSGTGEKVFKVTQRSKSLRSRLRFAWRVGTSHCLPQMVLNAATRLIIGAASAQGFIQAPFGEPPPKLRKSSSRIFGQQL